MAELTTPDARAAIADFGGPHAFAVAWLTGQLPDEGCSDVEVVSDTGEVTHRSMVITDYFQQGKAPSQICPLHPGRNMLATMAGWFGKDGPKPVAASDLGLPTQSAPGVAAQPRSEPDTRRAAEPPPGGVEAPAKKKRGFWGRIFGSKKKAPAADRPDDRPEDERPDRNQPR